MASHEGVVREFRKSSYSGGTTQDCVEVQDLAVGSAVRDTQHRELGALLFGAREWAALRATAVREV